MSDSDSHEIVIIRRNLEEGEEEHHGGVWKIAFADFMTAMMAFFLVMWLISANEKTRASIARYFNPIKFEETTPNRKGLRDPKDVETKAAPKGDDAGDYAGQTPPPDQKKAEQKRAPDSKAPAAAGNGSAASGDKKELSKGADSPSARVTGEGAAQQSQTSQSARTVVPSLRKETSGGETFRDPFAPSGPEIAAQRAPSSAPAPRPSVFPQQASVNAANPTAQTNVTNEPQPAPAYEVKQQIDKQTDQVAQQMPVQAEQAESTKLREDISNALKDELVSQPGPGIEVRATDEGMLISLMDEAGFEMFAVGSARPQARVAAMMEKVAQVLKSHAGRVVIRGHTDGRVYKSATYDNWRLSADRADMARDMLVSGGLDEKRVQRIEGLADRQLKKPDDPGAAENRRIEILLKDDRP